jgi:multidrug efflux system outer membrane protein
MLRSTLLRLRLQRLTEINISPIWRQPPNTYGARLDRTCSRRAVKPTDKISFCAIACATLLLAACNVLGPHYKRPDIPAPNGWSVDTTQTADESAAAAQATEAIATTRAGPPPKPSSPNPPPPPVTTATTVTAWPSADWWRGFGSSQLNDLISQAQKANDDIGSAVARVRQADAQVLIAGAPLLPAISVGFDASRQQAKSSVLAAPGTQPIHYNQFSAQASASYQLDFWGKNQAVLNAARYTAKASRYDRATVELTVMTSVATTYFQALELRDRLDVAQRDLSTAQTILKDLTFEETVGTANALDVAQQATTVAVINASIPPLRQQLRQSEDALAVLVGKMPQDLLSPEGTLKDLTEPEVGPGLPSELLVRRPDVAAAEAQLIAANANIQAARAAFFPSIDLTASGGFVSSALAGLISPPNKVFSLAGSVAQDIFQGGALVGGYRLNKARYDELLSDYHKSVISAFSNVEDALVASQQTAEQYRRQQDAVAKARRAYEITEIQLHAGTVNVLTVLNTQSALFSAEDALVQVRFAHLQALVQLFNALGGGWQQTAAQN